MLQAMAYIAAYCPRLVSVVRLTQNEFINGMAKILPSVIIKIAITAVEREGGSKFITAYEIPISNVPVSKLIEQKI